MYYIAIFFTNTRILLRYLGPIALIIIICWPFIIQYLAKRIANDGTFMLSPNGENLVLSYLLNRVLLSCG